MVVNPIFKVDVEQTTEKAMAAPSLNQLTTIRLGVYFPITIYLLKNVVIDLIQVSRYYSNVT